MRVPPFNAVASAVVCVWFWTYLSLLLDWTENDLDESTPREVRQCLRTLMRAIMLDADDEVIKHELKRFGRELSKVPTGYFGDNRESITYAIRRLTELTE